MSTKTLILLGVIAVGAYWYYQNEYLNSRTIPLEQQWQQNAAVMEKCIKRETSMAASAGLGGISMSLEGTTEFCAGEHGLYQEDGHWKKY